MEANQQLAPLKQIVSQYQVCFDFRELREIHHDHLTTIGYEVDLAGTHQGKRHLSNPDRLEYREIYRALRQLALGVIPAKSAPTRVEVLPFDHCVHACRSRHYRDDVELRLQVVHGPDRCHLVDGNQRACLHEILDHLRDLGVGEGAWMS